MASIIMINATGDLGYVHIFGDDDEHHHGHHESYIFDNQHA